MTSSIILRRGNRTGGGGSGPTPPENHVEMWGEGVGGALGLGVSLSELKQLTPVQVPGVTHVTSLAGGGQSSTGVLTTGGIPVMWGGATFGSQADNTQFDKYSPHTVLGVVGAETFIHRGAAMCLMPSGKVLCWGSNAGQLGIGGGVSHWDPTSYVETSEGKPLEGVIQATVGHFTSLFLLSDEKTLYRAGNFDLIGPNFFAKPEPTEESEGWNSTEKIVKILCTFEFMACQLANGELRLKGRSQHGEMGDGTIDTSNKPTKKWHTPLTKAGGAPLIVKDFSISEFNAIAHMPDNTVRTWGRNWRGEIGNGTIDPNDEAPQAYPFDPGISEVAEVLSGGGQASGGIVGDWFMLCRMKDGTLKGWGGNSDGELGVGHKRAILTPATVATGINDALDIACSESHVQCLRPGAPTSAPICMLAEQVAGTKNIRVKWVMPAGDKVEKFKLEWRHVENNPETGEAEGWKNDGTSNKLLPGEVIVGGGTTCEYVVVNPAVAPVWSPHNNQMEFRLEALYGNPKMLPGTTTVTKVGAGEYRFEWPLETGPNAYDFATKTTHKSGEMGWNVFYRISAGAYKAALSEELPPGQSSVVIKGLPEAGVECKVEGTWLTEWQTRIAYGIPAEMGAEIPGLFASSEPKLSTIACPHTKPQSNVVVMTSELSRTTAYSGLVTVVRGAQIGEPENAKGEKVPQYEWILTWPDQLNKLGLKEPGWIARWREGEQDFWSGWEKVKKEYLANNSGVLGSGITTFTITTFVGPTIAKSKIAPEVRVEGTKAGVGDILTAVPGKWANEPITSRTYQWYRLQNPPSTSDPSSELIVGATGSTYEVKPMDTDFAIRVLETPTNAVGTANIFGSSVGNSFIGAPTRVAIST